MTTSIPSVASGTLVALLCLLGMSSCADDPSHPPEYQTPIDAAVATSPKSCSEARAGSPEGGSISLDGQVAGCAKLGLACPLSGVPAFAAACDAGEPVAFCTAKLEWSLSCDPSTSLGDAGPDADDAGDAALDTGTGADTGSDTGADADADAGDATDAGGSDGGAD